MVWGHLFAIANNTWMQLKGRSFKLTLPPLTLTWDICCQDISLSRVSSASSWCKNRLETECVEGKFIERDFVSTGAVLESQLVSHPFQKRNPKGSTESLISCHIQTLQRPWWTELLWSTTRRRPFRHSWLPTVPWLTWGVHTVAGANRSWRYVTFVENCNSLFLCFEKYWASRPLHPCIVRCLRYCCCYCYWCCRWLVVTRVSVVPKAPADSCFPRWGQQKPNRPSAVFGFSFEYSALVDLIVSLCLLTSSEWGGCCKPLGSKEGPLCNLSNSGLK